MLNNLTVRNKTILYVVIALCIAIAGYFAYQYFNPAQPVTTLSQQQAETTRGVKQAADNAHIKLLQDQLKQTSEQIAILKNQKPDTIIKVVPVEIIKTIETERVTRGADFAIVTDPTNPTKVVDLKEVAKLPASTPITLNEYNVQAYRDHLTGFNIYHSFTSALPISEVSVDYSKKVTKDGKYVGVVGAYDVEHSNIKAGLRVTF